jgi:HK97 family phage major capsid protein/HK97 family phage prohead protease
LIEILEHTPDAVRMDRINNRAALLRNHDYDQQIGVVESGRVDPDKVLRAQVRFSKGPVGAEIMREVDDGIMGKVSVGYRVIDYKFDTDDKGNETNTYRVTDWEPVEVSIVSVPADDTVGVGRMVDQSGQPPHEPETEQENSIMPDNTPIEGGSSTEQRAPTPVDLTVVRNEAVLSGEAQERARQTEIEKTCAQYKREDVQKIGRMARESGMKIDEFRASLLEALATNPIPTDSVDRKAAEQYDLGRMMRSLAGEGEAGHERECSRDIERALGRGPTGPGVFIPSNVWAKAACQLDPGFSKRILEAGVATGAAELVATDHLASEFIEVLRNMLMVGRMGARPLTGLVGDVAIPKQTAASTATWLATETTDAANSELTTGTVSMTPHTVAVYSDITRQLLLQSTPAANALVSADVLEAILTAVDLAYINGTGDAPTGILQTAGIGSVIGGAAGAAPTWDNMVKVIQEVAIDNALRGNTGWLINNATAFKCARTLKDATLTGYIWDLSNNPIVDGMTTFLGERAGVSNQVPSNIDKGGSGPVLSAALYGNWGEALIGEWGGLELAVSTEALLLSGGIRFVARKSVDLALRHPESFSAIQDIITT